MSFVVQRDPHDHRARIVPAKRSTSLTEAVVTSLQLLLIFSVLRIAMLKSGLTFFYVPYLDELLGHVIVWCESFFVAKFY
ncbi:MAG: hypothetical protein K1X79_04085 [Oligoflexia bacterium]|nr:hypothetical protein [Oligoflexia bacterium]